MLVLGHSLIRSLVCLHLFTCSALLASLARSVALTHLLAHSLTAEPVGQWNFFLIFKVF